MLIRSLPLVLLALVSAALHAETPTFNKGKELILLNVSGPGGFGYNQIYVAGGTNPISDQAWETYEADFGYFKNPTRRALFVNSPFLAAPRIPMASRSITPIPKAIPGCGIPRIGWRSTLFLSPATQI